MNRFTTTLMIAFCIIVLSLLMYAGTADPQNRVETHAAATSMANVVPQPTVDVLEEHTLALTAPASAALPRNYIRLHDKGSGSEILCFSGHGADVGGLVISCVPTGRKWY